jgi:hypothetical protein
MITVFNRGGIFKAIAYLCVLSASVHASILIQKNTEFTGDNELNFSFLPMIHQAQDKLFFGARSLVEGVSSTKEFALMSFSFNTHQLLPIAHEKVMLNRERDQLNPLYNADIIHLSLLATTADLTYMDQAHGKLVQPSIIAVTAQDPLSVYLVEHESGHSVSVAKNLMDAHGQLTQKILSISGAKGDVPFVTAAVTNTQGEFGQPGSGIALLNIFKHVTGTGEVKEFIFKQIDAKLEEILQENEEVKEEEAKSEVKAEAETAPAVPEEPADQSVQATESESPEAPPRAFPLDITTAALKIQNDLAAIGTVVDMYWDVSLNRLYVTLQVAAGGNEGDGARAVCVVGFMGNGKAKIMPIAPEQVFVGNDQIIGARGAGELVSLHKVQTMWTSMHLPYLVVVGGNGTPDETKNQVYALPLVNHKTREGRVIDSDIHGTLAAKNAESESQYSDKMVQAPSRLIRRAVHLPASSAHDTYTTQLVAENAPVLVGGGPLHAGDIDQLFIKGDALYAVVTHAKEGDCPGVYHSQALFDANGKVCAWTKWKRIVTFDNTINAAAFNRLLGTMMTVRSSTEKSSDNMLELTLWQPGEKPGHITRLNDLLREVLPQEQGGVQGLFEFCPSSASGLTDLTVMVATGLHTVAVVPTDHTNAQTLKAAPTNVIPFKGDVLNSVGAIITADLVRDQRTGAGSLLWVGGTKGVAVLTDDDNNGWHVEDSLLDTHNAQQQMTFKSVGDYRSVCKLMGDEHFMYVLTNNTLDRIDLRDKNFGGTTIARAADLASSAIRFHDLLVSHGFIIIATNRGLFVSENGAPWKHVEVPGDTQAVYSLTAVSASGRPSDFVSERGGMVYALSGLRSLNRSALSRFAVRLTDAGVQMSLLNDRTIDGKEHPFIVFDKFREYCVTDGAFYLHGAGKDVSAAPALTAGTTRRFTQMPALFQEASSMTTALYSCSLGSWIIAGDFGIKGTE